MGCHTAEESLLERPVVLACDGGLGSAVTDFAIHDIGGESSRPGSVSSSVAGDDGSLKEAVGHEDAIAAAPHDAAGAGRALYVGSGGGGGAYPDIRHTAGALRHAHEGAGVEVAAHYMGSLQNDVVDIGVVDISEESGVVGISAVDGESRDGEAASVELAHEGIAGCADGREAGNAAEVEVIAELDDASLVGLNTAVDVGGQLLQLGDGGDGDVGGEAILVLRHGTFLIHVVVAGRIHPELRHFFSSAKFIIVKIGILATQ